MSIENDKPTDADISDLYRSTQIDGPSATLDAAILAKAEAAVTPRSKRPAWIAPVGLAATVLLGVNLAMNLKDYSTEPDIYSESVSVVSANKPAQVAQPGSIEEAVRAAPEIEFELNRELEARLKEVDLADRSGRIGQFANHNAEAPERESPTSFANADADNSAQPEQQQKMDGLTDSTYRPTSETSANSGSGGEFDYYQVPIAKPAPRQRIEASGSRAARTPDTQAEERTEQQVVMQDTMRQIAKTERDSTTVGALENKSVAAQTPAAVVASATSDVSTQNDYSPVPAPVQSVDSADKKSGLEEIVVTGAKRSDRDDSPHRRLNAKDQSTRVRRPISSSLFSDNQEAVRPATAAAPPTENTALYFCDLAALKIDDNSVEKAIVDARTLEPPLNAATWPGYIRELTETHDFKTACAQLAAFRRLYPDLILIDPLPITLPSETKDD